MPVPAPRFRGADSVEGVSADHFPDLLPTLETTEEGRCWGPDTFPFVTSFHCSGARGLVFSGSATKRMPLLLIYEVRVDGTR